MNSRHRMVSAAVALICTAILVLFTDIELKLFRWVNCGPLALQRDRHSSVCR
ncbi:MAG: hypothetical protein WCF98_00845 [Synechococcus sp. ELA057]